MLALFLKTFLKDLDVGAVCPTSRYGVRRVLKRMNFEKRLVVVEYGPGTGAFTSQLLERLTPDSKLLLIEKNEDFIRVLGNRFGHDPRIHLFQGSAEDVESFLKISGETQADYILSGIPFSRIPPPQTSSILSATKRSLRKGASFLVYQYMPSIKRVLSSVFSQTTMKFILYNFPPIFLVISKQ